MAKTPEGKVKDQIKKALLPYEGELRAWWPVPGGYGESTIDCHVVYRGRHIAIEAKKHKGKTTALQRKFLTDNARAGGISIVIEGDEHGGEARNLGVLKRVLVVLSGELVTGNPTEVFW